MESKELSSRESVNKHEIPSEKPLFEIRDRVHLDVAIIALVSGIFLLVDKKNLDLYNLIVGCYLIGYGIRGFFTYPYRKIRFYPSFIVLFLREKPLRIVKLSEINEQYLFPYGLHYDDYRPPRMAWSAWVIILPLVLLCFWLNPILIPVLVLGCFLLAPLMWLLLGYRASLRSDTLLLLSPEKESFIAIPLQRLQREEKMRVEAYLQSHLKLNPETLEKRWIYLPNNKG